uniref:NADH dehydrogenase [ubiquinone] 1 alpha subcomplex assembly factor 3 n=1 Tax=Trieres chinensis TaxID=1514140 RepID=A0A7S2EHF7_TRICV|mmetsp:Transcript_24098/g.48790  ORF Transcript_24098/g.48790 Transcript_24098/m.48790 type:complete len:216 (+) Transcript_24098:180-827(+)
MSRYALRIGRTLFRDFRHLGRYDSFGCPSLPPFVPCCSPSFGHSSSNIKRNFSEIGRGHDLLADSLAFGERRKIILDGYYPTGFDVIGMLDLKDENTAKGGDNNPSKSGSSSKTLHMNGSIIAFPHSCFLWNVKEPKEVTSESLAVVALQSPPVELLFIGTNRALPPREVNKIKKDFKKKGIVVEQLDLTNAMGTFNILNGEDRRVAVALLLDPE